MNKSRYILGVAAIAAGLSLFSCSKSFLDRPTLGALTPDLVPTPDGVRGLLIGSYAALDGQQGGTVPGISALGGGGPWEAAPSNWVYGSVAGGDAHKGSSATDQPPINLIMQGAFSADNGFLNTKWKAVFEGITRTNNTIKALNKLSGPGLLPGEATSIRAEARFLRGHYYFELKKMFNQVPWIDETTTDPRQPNTDTTGLWKHIEDDFKFAFDSLPATGHAWNDDPGRANKWAAGAYLAKVYVYEKNYPAAEPLFTNVINNGMTATGKKYDLSTVNFEDNFNAAKKNNSETVFDIQMAANTGSNTMTKSNQGEMLNFPYNSPFGCCGFYQPSQDLVNSYQVDATTGLPNLNSYNATTVAPDSGRITSDTLFTVDTKPVDPRLDWTVGRRGVPYLDWGPHPGQRWIRDAAYAGVYAPKKNVYYQATQSLYHDANGWAPGTAINIHIIRFADVLLLAAETEVMQNNIPLALDYVNRVRARAARPSGFVSIQDNNAFAKAIVNSAADFATVQAAAGYAAGDWVVRNDLVPAQTWVVLKVAADKVTKTWNPYIMPNYKVSPYDGGTFALNPLAAVKFERKLELAMEGQRYFDLARWGDLNTVMNTYYQFESKFTGDLQGAQSLPRDRYYPVPQRQIDLSISGGKPTLTQNNLY